VCVGDGQVSSYSIDDGAHAWTMSIDATDLVLAQLDDDPALELVFATGDGSAGVIIDGATRLQEWQRTEGFGSHLATGRLGPAGQAGFIGAQAFGAVEGFSAFPYAPTWSIDSFNTDRVAAGDTDADGRDEFAIGDGQWGTIRVHDAATRQMLYELPNHGWGLSALGFVDFDGDARSELWYGSVVEHSSDRQSAAAGAVVNPVTGQTRLDIESYWHEVGASRLVDIDGTGRLDWIIGTRGESVYQGLLRVLDADSAGETWRAPYGPGNTNEPFQMTYRSLLVTTLDGNPDPKLIAVGGGPSVGFRFLVIDGQSKAVEQQFPALWEQVHEAVGGSQLVQYVPGGNPELLAAVNSTGIGYPSVRLRVYALPDGELLWSSPVVGGGHDRALAVDVGPLSENAAPGYLLVHTSGLAAFDSADGQPMWDLALEVSGALILARPQPAFLTWTEVGEVNVYDADTRTVMDTFTLPEPLEQLARLPGRDDLLLAVAGERLLLISQAGDVLAESGWIGPGAQAGDRLDIVAEGRGWRVSTGRSHTTYLHAIPDPDIIFSDGFE
jgi:hypothetical protein